MLLAWPAVPTVPDRLRSIHQAERYGPDMRRGAGALVVVAVAIAILAGVAAGANVVGSDSGSAHNPVAVHAGPTQFVVAASALASGVRRIDPNCYLPTSTHPVGRVGADAPTRFAIWRTMSNPRETTITTPPEATAAQNGRVLFCLRQRGFVPEVRVGNDFRTD
jgi:hypothetical protein